MTKTKKVPKKKWKAGEWPGDFYGPLWYKLPEGMSDEDRTLIIKMAWANHQYLHHCNGTPDCVGRGGSEKLCDTCLHAARLSLQYLRPILRKQFIDQFHRAFNWRCESPHPGSD